MELLEAFVLGHFEYPLDCSGHLIHQLLFKEFKIAGIKGRKKEKIFLTYY
jgi:hypothetical protein